MKNTDFERIRSQFPILDQTIEGVPLVYLDSGASTQKPNCVIDAISDHYKTINANVHRGVHTLSVRCTEAMENAREKVRSFINAEDPRQIIFTRGTTESINIVASGISQTLKKGDEIILSQMEHHSNIVPWQLACERSGAVIKVIPLTEKGELDLKAYKSLLSDKTKVVALTHVSNVLGTINPVEKIISLAKANNPNTITVIDGAQAIAHLPVDVQKMGCDFYAFSGHKMYAPAGIGVLYGTREALENLPVYQGGGDMIDHVSFEGTTYAGVPFKFEAGTPNIEGAIALGTAVNWLKEIGLENIREHEKEILSYLEDRMRNIEGLKIYGESEDKSGAFSFGIKGIHPTDLGTLLDHQGVAIRTGHHCAQPLIDCLGVVGTVRASLGVYNNKQDIDKLYEATMRAKSMLI